MALIGYIHGDIEGGALLSSLFPVLSKQYWYLDSFMALQLISPILSAGASRLDTKKFVRLSFLCLTTCSLLGSLDGLGVNNGYSVMWLIVLWLAGGSIKRLEKAIRGKFNTKLLTALAIVLPLATTCLQVLTFRFLGTDQTWWIRYVNPCVVIYSLVFFVLLLRVRVESAALKRTLPQLSALAFSVYLIDESSWIRGAVLYDRFRGVPDLPLKIGIPFIMGISLVMFAAFLLLDFLRRSLFSAFVGKIQMGRRATSAPQE